MDYIIEEELSQGHHNNKFLTLISTIELKSTTSSSFSNLLSNNNAFNSHINNPEDPSSINNTSLQESLSSVLVPKNRLNFIKNNWNAIIDPIITHCNLAIRYNIKKHAIELKTTHLTTESSILQRASDFIKALILGFDINDAIALIRLNDLFIDSFTIHDVKILHGDHIGRAIARIVGEGGKIKNQIENLSKTRIVVAAVNVHILGSYTGIGIAKDAICRLVIGSTPGKVLAHLTNVVNRQKNI